MRQNLNAAGERLMKTSFVPILGLLVGNVLSDVTS
jgi:hypothetical protein